MRGFYFSVASLSTSLANANPQPVDVFQPWIQSEGFGVNRLMWATACFYMSGMRDEPTETGSGERSPVGTVNFPGRLKAVQPCTSFPVVDQSGARTMRESNTHHQGKKTNMWKCKHMHALGCFPVSLGELMLLLDVHPIVSAYRCNRLVLKDAGQSPRVIGQVVYLPFTNPLQRQTFAVPGAGSEPANGFWEA